MRLQKPKGTQDILPLEAARWQYVENLARETFKKYNYGEIRTPMFEHYEVISRSVGDTTDIVTKEMYDFYDKGDRHITLRPAPAHGVFQRGDVALQLGQQLAGLRCVQPHQPLGEVAHQQHQLSRDGVPLHHRMFRLNHLRGEQLAVGHGAGVVHIG